MYIYTVCVYIYIYIERERDTCRCIYMCMYNIYIYIYVCITHIASYIHISVYVIHASARPVKTVWLSQQRRGQGAKTAGRAIGAPCKRIRVAQRERGGTLGQRSQKCKITRLSSATSQHFKLPNFDLRVSVSGLKCRLELSQTRRHTDTTRNLTARGPKTELSDRRSRLDCIMASAAESKDGKDRVRDAGGSSTAAGIRSLINAGRRRCPPPPLPSARAGAGGLPLVKCCPVCTRFQWKGSMGGWISAGARPCWLGCDGVLNPKP